MVRSADLNILPHFPVRPDFSSIFNLHVDVHDWIVCLKGIILSIMTSHRNHCLKSIVCQFEFPSSRRGHWTFHRPRFERRPYSQFHRMNGDSLNGWQKSSSSCFNIVHIGTIWSCIDLWDMTLDTSFPLRWRLYKSAFCDFQIYKYNNMLWRIWTSSHIYVYDVSNTQDILSSHI